MNKIAFTYDFFWDGEASAIVRLLDEGFWRVHLRKPFASYQEMVQLLDAIPACYHHRLTLHNFFELSGTYNIGGLHISDDSESIPAGFTGLISRSYFTIEELPKLSPYDYVILWPIFNSISIPGLKAGFKYKELVEAQQNGLINESVYAMSGVTPKLISIVETLGFGGVCMLGAAWWEFYGEKEKKQILE